MGTVSESEKKTVNLTYVCIYNHFLHFELDVNVH